MNYWEIMIAVLAVLDFLAVMCIIAGVVYVVVMEHRLDKVRKEFIAELVRRRAGDRALDEQFAGAPPTQRWAGDPIPDWKPRRDPEFDDKHPF